LKNDKKLMRILDRNDAINGPEVTYTHRKDGYYKVTALPLPML